MKYITKAVSWITILFQELKFKNSNIPLTRQGSKE
jgi:hypothetical protein